VTAGGVDSYLFDASALIEYFVRGKKPRPLTRLANDGRLQVPQRVHREVVKANDRARTWTERHRDNVVIRETDANIAHLERVSRAHAGVLTTAKGAADPIVVAMAIYYPERVVVTEDRGVQVACHLERVRWVPLDVFLRVEGI
jgi:predicted nucleic acid-binding protein